MNHCGWCSTGNRAAVVAAVRADPNTNLRVLCDATGIGPRYAEKVRAKARKLGCLTHEEPKPPPPRPVAWTLPPIGAVYVRTA